MPVGLLTCCPLRSPLPLPSAPPGCTRRPHASSSAAASPSVVEPAAAQIVHKALRFITGDQTPPPPEGTTPPSKVATAFDSQSFLDKVRTLRCWAEWPNRCGMGGLAWGLTEDCRLTCHLAVHNN